MRQAHLFYLVTLPCCPPFLVSRASVCPVSIHTTFFKEMRYNFRGRSCLAFPDTALMAVEGELQRCTFPNGSGHPWAPQFRVCKDESVGDVDTSFRASQREAQMSLGLGILAICGARPSLPWQPAREGTEERRGTEERSLHAQGGRRQGRFLHTGFQVPCDLGCHCCLWISPSLKEKQERR